VTAIVAAICVVPKIHKATCGYEKFDSGGFTARRECINGEQEEDDVDACNTIELRVA
jgi:hypothetical protein